jgi:hypothetical protein
MVRKIIIVILLIASLGYALYTYWPMLSPYLPKMQKAKPSITAPAAAPSSREAVPQLATKEAEEFQIYVPTVEVKLVDPFAVRVEVKTRAEVPLPLPTIGGEEKPAVKPVEPKLEGIWVDSEMKVAFISGQALPAGGTILGWKVVSISKEKVVLQKGSATKTLRLEGK